MGSGSTTRAVAALVAVAALGIAACVTSRPGPTPVDLRPSGAPTAVVPPSAPADPSVVPSRPPVAPSVTPGGPLASSGAIAVLGNDGSLWLVDSSGTSILLAPPGDGAFQFPAWSPDGSRIAAIHYGVDNSIRVFDVVQVVSGDAVQPVTIFESSPIGPFYLSWTPDSRTVAFLASDDEGGALRLRLAPADGSAPLDGSGPDASVGTGNPFYFDWIAEDRLLAHVGTGPGALVGELGLDGEPVGPAIAAPGEFRSAVVSRDGHSISYVRVDDGGASAVVVAARDGSAEHEMPVFGPAAMAFDPSSARVASIGPAEPPATPFQIPIGPVRLLDAATGAVDTVLDGQVVSFWWSPDGATIAALRVQPIEVPASSAVPSPAAGATATEVRLLFVDVASGEIGPQAAVQPGRLFIDQVLNYFDQYALSHRLWAPDSSSFLLPVEGDDGLTRIAVMPRNGDPIIHVDGAVAFWSPVGSVTASRGQTPTSAGAG